MVLMASTHSFCIFLSSFCFLPVSVVVFKSLDLLRRLFDEPCITDIIFYLIIVALIHNGLI